MIDAPIAWDGSGLLPGESLARHRTRQPESEQGVNGEPQGVFADTAETGASTPTRLSIEEISQELAPQAGEGIPVDEEYVEEILVDEGVIDEEPASNPAVPEATLAASGFVVHEPSTQREMEHSAEIHESELEDFRRQSLL